MSKDRKVSTDALETLGTIIDEYQKRDAIHLAVEPCIAGELLHPNADVRIIDGKAYYASRKNGEAIGKVDPFLEDLVPIGQRFWLVIYPREITSLRHVWSHPAFADEVLPVAYHEEDLIDTTPPVGSRSVALDMSDSEKWIRDWVKSEFNQNEDSDEWYTKVTYDDIMDATHRYVNGHIGYFNVGNNCVYGPPDEFWDHYENVTGERVKNHQRGSFFSCSC